MHSQLNLKNNKTQIAVLKLVFARNFCQLFNAIYNSGNIPADWLRSIFAAAPEKSNSKACEEHCWLVSLMSHALKIFMNIIHKRIYSKYKEKSGDMQFGFMKSLGTRETLNYMQLFVQK